MLGIGKPMGFKVAERFAIEVVREIKETNVLIPDHLELLRVTYKVGVTAYDRD